MKMIVSHVICHTFALYSNLIGLADHVTVENSVEVSDVVAVQKSDHD